MNLKKLRHQKIIDLIKKKGFMPIDELAELLTVTQQTIRRDINQLCEKRILKRYHGGATLHNEKITPNYYTHPHTIKNTLTDLVADHILNDSSLFLSGGPDIEAVANSLVQKRNKLCIITNNIRVASIVSSRSDYTTIIASGIVRSSDGSITGIATLDFIKQFKVDFSIVSIATIESDGSLLDFDYKEVSVSQAMIENSRTRLLIANSTTFNKNALVRLGHITDFNIFFTNKLPSNILKKKLDDANITYCIADGY